MVKTNEEEEEAKTAIVLVTVAGKKGKDPYRTLTPNKELNKESGDPEIECVTAGWEVKEGTFMVEILDKDLGNFSIDFVTPTKVTLNVTTEQKCVCGRPLREVGGYLVCDGTDGCGNPPGSCTCTSCGVCGRRLKPIGTKKYCWGDYNNLGCRQPASTCTRPPC